MPNRLHAAQSPYLRRAADQPVNWYEWGEEAFRDALDQDKPILLSIGGVWCHWCHVMAHESFENDEIARFINDHFIAVKVDRDERPDIDRRYQDVVLRIAGTGGWPLTVFLTPEGKAFFGGTYFPPEDGWQRAGLKTIMTKLTELYRQDKWRLTTVAEELYQNMLAASAVEMKGELTHDLSEKIPSVLLSAMDMENGGFGSAPKFHHACAYEFLINHFIYTGDDFTRKALETSLDAMAKGGVWDHLLGGFFRYSTDAKWIVPHFEKMLYDNAELLRVYAIAWSVLGKDLYRNVCDGIVRYYTRCGTDENGCFYASQDADIGTLDEGGYYTFSLDEAAALLSDDEAQVTRLHFDLNPAGPIHHDPSKNVLHVAMEADEVARHLEMPLPTVRRLIDSAGRKLLAHRERNREAPFIDRTIYSNYNGLMIDALCTAGTLLGNPEHIGLAERAAQALLGNLCRGDLLLHREGIDGFSEDYLFLAKGLLRLYEATQNEQYLSRARRLIDKALELFWDPEGWGFFDSTRRTEGYLSVPVKNIQDSPVESANGAAPALLLLLEALTEDRKYAGYAEKTLQAFSGLFAEYPLASHSYSLGLQAYTRGICKVGTSRHFDEALKAYRPHKVVVKTDADGVVVCVKETCRRFETYTEASQHLG